MGKEPVNNVLYGGFAIADRSALLSTYISIVGTLNFCLAVVKLIDVSGYGQCTVKDYSSLNSNSSLSQRIYQPIREELDESIRYT